MAHQYEVIDEDASPEEEGTPETQPEDVVIPEFNASDYIGFGEEDQIYTFGEADDRGVYEHILPFDQWVRQGPQDWTQSDWDVYTQLSGSDIYKAGLQHQGNKWDYRTVEDQYRAMLGIVGFPEESYTDLMGYALDPRMWEMLQNIAGLGGFAQLDPQSPAITQLQEFLLPGGAVPRGAGELSYAEDYESEGGPWGEFGPWTYDAPPVQPEVGWGDSADDQANLAYLQAEYEGSRNDSDWFNLVQGEWLAGIREKLRGMGMSADLANGILDRIDQGALLSRDPFVIAFDNYVPIGLNEEGFIDPADWQVVDDLVYGDAAGDAEEVVAEQTDQQSFAAMFGDDADFWEYGPQYEIWLRDVKYKDNLNLDYWNERQESIDNPGDRRSGEPISWTPDAGIEIPDADPWLDTGEYSPLDVANLGPYATGIRFGDPEPFASQDAWGRTWSVGTQTYPDIIDISEEDQQTFIRSEQFFEFIRDDATYRDALNTDGTVNINTYWQKLKGDESISQEDIDYLEDSYNYYGAEWERISPDYYLAAQKEASKFMGTAKHGEMVKDLASALGPHANLLVTMLQNAGHPDADLQYVLGILSGAAAGDFAGTDKTDEGEEGEEEEGTGGILGATPPGTSVKNTPAADADDLTSAVDGANNNTVVPNNISQNNSSRNSFAPLVSDGSFVDVFNSFMPGYTTPTSSKRSSSMSKLLDSAKLSYSLGGKPVGRVDDVKIPNFVLDAATIGTSDVDPVAYWMGLSSSQRDFVMSSAADAGLDTTLSSHANPEGDLYRTSNDITKFYLPRWAVDLVYPMDNPTPLSGAPFADYDGVIPDYAWWQSIGAERRADLQHTMMGRGDDTSLVAVRKMDIKTVGGQEVAFVSESKGFSIGADGVSLNTEWSTEEDRDRDAYSVTPDQPASFTDFIRWAIAQNPGIDPMRVFMGNQTYYWDQEGRNRAAIGLESYVYPNEPTHRPFGGWPNSLHIGRGETNKVYMSGLAGDSHYEENIRGIGPNGETTYIRPGDRGMSLDGQVIKNISGMAAAPGRGSWGALSRTVWNYFLNNYDDWADSPTSVPLPADFQGNLSDISTDDAGSVTSGEWYNPSLNEDSSAEDRENYSAMWRVLPDTKEVWFDPDFGNQRAVENYGDVGRSSFGSTSLDMDDFFSEVSGEIGTDRSYGLFATDFINWDEGESWALWNLSEGYEGNHNVPLYYTDGSSSQAMWGALSLFIPIYEEYLQSYDEADSGMDVPSLSEYMNELGESEGSRPTYDPYDVGASAVQALAFQENAETQYVSYLDTQDLMAEWILGRSVIDTTYINQDYGGSRGTDGILGDTNRNAPINAPGWNSNLGNPGVLFYDVDFSERIDAPGGFAAGGLVGLRLQGGGPVPPSNGIGDLQNSPDIAQLESLVQQDPILQEAVDAFMGTHPRPQEAINRAIEKYGEELLMKLARIVQTSGGPTSTYVPGEGGGLADTIPALIDGDQPAALSSGEFVVPADVVSHLGDGNNENGAGKLDSMMSRVRVEKTGVPEQPGPINEEEVLPA